MPHKTFCDVTFQSAVSQSFRLSHDILAVIYDCYKTRHEKDTKRKKKSFRDRCIKKNKNKECSTTDVLWLL